MRIAMIMSMYPIIILIGTIFKHGDNLSYMLARFCDIYMKYISNYLPSEIALFQSFIT